MLKCQNAMSKKHFKMLKVINGNMLKGVNYLEMINGTVEFNPDL